LNIELKTCTIETWYTVNFLCYSKHNEFEYFVLNNAYSLMAKKQTTQLLEKLRSLMKSKTYAPHEISAYIISSNDAHFSEYTADCDRRIAFISGFTGSRGTAVITDKQAALWTVGIYHHQASKELGDDWILMKEGLSETPEIEQWLGKVLPAGSFVGVDPFLLTEEAFTRCRRKLNDYKIELKEVATNLVDIVWGEDRPPRTGGMVYFLPIFQTGRSWEQKISDVCSIMTRNRVQHLVLSALDEVAWLLNLRGSDIPYNPVFFAYVVISNEDAVSLFIEEGKIEKKILDKFLMNKSLLRINCFPYDAISDYITNCLVDKDDNSLRIWLPHGTSHALCSLVPEINRYTAQSPILLLKAVKNKSEVTGMRNAHIKDAVAHCMFFGWLEKQIVFFKNQGITELDASAKFEQFRSMQQDYKGPSFKTISAFGANASIIHYSPSEQSNQLLNDKSLYLIDSGGQYIDGTTDTTRTLMFNECTEHQRRCYTMVLKGHIALAQMVFPEGCIGARIDALSRTFLWKQGLDYPHGTGHGIGHHLCVHEGPSGFGPSLGSWNCEGIVENMILTIEPGYYENENFGIRIENAYVVVPAETEFNYEKKKYLRFEPLTLVPIQKKMIVREMMTNEEIEWLNKYHAKCLQTLSESLMHSGDIDAVKWLRQETNPL
ncbi:Xaa-Pro aminopeptidase 1, partial [Trichinella pseudospiralis]